MAKVKWWSLCVLTSILYCVLRIRLSLAGKLCMRVSSLDSGVDECEANGYRPTADENGYGGPAGVRDLPLAGQQKAILSMALGRVWDVEATLDTFDMCPC